MGRVVEYSLAPIFPFPAAPEDGYIALTWAVNNAHSYGADPTRIAVAGRDAGGSLAGIARDRKEYKLFTRALIAPLLGPSLTRLADTRATHAEDLDQYECARNCQAYLPDVVQRIEPRIRGIVEKETSDSDVSSKDIRRIYKGTIIAAGGFTRENAEQIIVDGHADLVALGRMFISNPDLPERLRSGAPLNRYDRATFYGGDARGYTDYKLLSEDVVA